MRDRLRYFKMNSILIVLILFVLILIRSNVNKDNLVLQYSINGDLRTEVFDNVSSYNDRRLELQSLKIVIY